MPIQVPTISVDPTEQPLNAPRLQMPSLNVDQQAGKQLGDIEDVAKQGIKLHNEIADQTSDTVGTNARNEYLIWRQKRLYGDPESGWTGYTNMTGADPQDTYKKFDEEEKEKLNDLAQAPDHQNWSQETQNVVNRRLSNAFEQSKLETLTQYSNQKKKYDDGISDTNIGLSQQAMYSASSFIKPGDDTSFGLVDAHIAEIRNTNIAKALRNGGAVNTGDYNPSDAQDYIDRTGNGETLYLNANGQKQYVKLTPSVRADIQEDISKGLSDTTMNLIHSKDLDKASAMQDHYGNYLDGYNKGEITKAFGEEQVKQKANGLARQLQDKSPEQVKNALNKEDPEIARKALDFIEENASHLAALKKNQQTTNYQALFSQIQKLKQANPDATMADVENQDFYPKFVNKISPEQLKAIQNSVEAPKHSDPAAIERTMNVLRGNDPNYNAANLQASDIAKITSGLGSDSEGKLLKSRLMQAALPSNSQKNQSFQHAMQELKTQALNTGMVQNDNSSGTAIVPGGSQAQQLNQLQIEFANHLDKMGDLSYEQIKKEAASFAQNKLQNQPPGFFRRVFGGSSEMPQQLQMNQPQVMPLSQAQINGKAIKEFTSTYGRAPNQKELESYISNHKGSWK